MDYVYYEADWLNGKHQIFCVQPNYTDVTNASIDVDLPDVQVDHTTSMFTQQQTTAATVQQTCISRPILSQAPQPHQPT